MAIDKEDMISIPMRKYNSLMEDEHRLQCLYDWGVDNWNGYEEAMIQYREEKGEE